MSLFKKSEKLDINAEDGIWLDYKDHTWIFFIKDQVWQTEEIRRAEKADVTIRFVQKGIVDMFLLDIFDCIETSDIPFCIKEAEGEIITDLNGQISYMCEIVLLDEGNTVMADRQIPLKLQASEILKEKLKGRLQEKYTSDDFDKAYQKLSASFEPYEFEDDALFAVKD